MNIRTKRQDEEKKAEKDLQGFRGEETKGVSESIDGRLCINKTSCGETDLIRIHPRSGNEVEIS